MLGGRVFLFRGSSLDKLRSIDIIAQDSDQLGVFGRGLDNVRTGTEDETTSSLLSSFQDP